MNKKYLIVAIIWSQTGHTADTKPQHHKIHPVAQTTMQQVADLLNREIHLYGCVTAAPHKLPTLTPTEMALNILATRLAFYQKSKTTPSRLRSDIFLKYHELKTALEPVKISVNQLHRLNQESTADEIDSATQAAVAAGLTFGIRYACQYASEEPRYFCLPSEILTQLEIAGLPHSRLAPELIPAREFAETKSEN